MNNIRFGLEDGGKTYVNTKKWHGICFRSLIQKNYLTTYNTKYKKKVKLNCMPILPYVLKAFTKSTF